jgi:hypothetical protein
MFYRRLFSPSLPKSNVATIELLQPAALYYTSTTTSMMLMMCFVVSHAQKEVERKK